MVKGGRDVPSFVAGIVLLACLACVVGIMSLVATAGEDAPDTGSRAVHDRGVPAASVRPAMPAPEPSVAPGPVLPADVAGSLYPAIDPHAVVVAAAVGRVRELGGSMTEPEMRAVLVVAGWPAELHDQALAVSWCESRYRPGAIGDAGASVGLWQLNAATWFRYAGEDPEQWADPVVNARTAWATYQYDIGRGYPPFKQWSCKP